MLSEPFIGVLENEGIEFSLNEPMNRHTSFKIGGAAEVFINAASAEQLKAVMIAARKFGVPISIIGKGSNLLVSDEGIEGAVVSLAGMSSIKLSENIIRCEAGASLAAVCIAARDAGLSGLEFAYGIPGSIGGAVYMNAGAYGGDMAGAVIEAEAMDYSGNIRSFSDEELSFGYRTSAFRHNELVIISATVALKKADKAVIAQKMEELLQKRKEKQPLEYPSAGSTFKRPEGYFAGALIEKNGLKGAVVGGAQVSCKHAGFIINTGAATAGEVKALIEKIQKTVMQADGVWLEPEVLFVGKEEKQ